MARSEVKQLLDTKRVDPEDFELLSVLGTGGYGKVFLVRKVSGSDVGSLYAMKVLKKATVVRKRKVMEHTLTERSVLEAIRNFPFLVTLHYAFQTEANLHLIMDYICGGELFTHLHHMGPFHEAQARIYAAEVTLALEHLHSLGIVYRDIKLENILLDEDGHVVLTDFGLSKEMQPEQVTHSYCGTVEYMAPEIVKGGAGGHDKTVDWWSLGVLLFELLTCESPFAPSREDCSQKEISRRILHCQPPIPEDVTDGCRDLLEQLMHKDPEQRLGSKGAQDVKQHEWFKNLDWSDVLDKRLPTPFKPYITDELDTGNFSTEFTTLAPIQSPAPPPTKHKDIFRGYSFIGPAVLFTDNIFSQEHNGVKLLKNSPFLKLYTLEDKVLGHGSFSSCRVCTEKSTGTRYAVKIVSTRHNPSREIKILKMCQGHRNIIRLHDVQTDELHVYIVMELMEGGELLDRLQRQHSFTEAQASSIFRQLVSAVSFMHKKRIVHRDLKPENLMFSSADEECTTVKVIDFGFARSVSEETQALTTPCYTLVYAAPEVLSSQNKDGYTEACDLWSLGVILYAMLCGHAPFYGQSVSTEDIIERIKAGQFSFSGEEWSSVSDAAKEVIEGLLTVDAKHRLTLEGLASHSWLTPQSAPSTPLQTSCVLGREKGTASAALKHTFHAFHQATKAGFTLGDVSRARLARRRKERGKGTSPCPANGGSNSSTASTSSSVELSPPDLVLSSSEGSLGNSSEHIRPSRLALT